MPASYWLVRFRFPDDSEVVLTRHKKEPTTGGRVERIAKKLFPHIIPEGNIL
jgi:hypothetical protein